MQDSLSAGPRLHVRACLRTRPGRLASPWMAAAWRWWAVQGSNLRPLPCEGNALPLS